jgi:TonB-like protein
VRWTAGRRFAVAIAGAVALHGLVIALLLGRRADRAVPRQERPPIAIELLPRRPSVATGPAEPLPVGPPSVAPDPVPHRRPGPPARSGPSVALEASPAPERGIAGSPGSGDPARAPLSLTLRDLGGGVPVAESNGLVREKSREERLAEEKAEVKRRIESWAGDSKAKDRAQFRDAYWQTVEDALRRGFQPEWEAGDRGSQERGGVARFFEGWQRSASAYGRTGNPFGEGGPGARSSLGLEMTTLDNRDRGLDSPSLSGLPASGANVVFSVETATVDGTAFTRRLVATVRIRQRSDGSLFSVELLGTSGSGAYDKLAVAQARALDRLRLGPPRQGHETLWAFETDFIRVPPAPIAGCALDDFVPKYCWHPLQKRIRSRVRLLGIY